MRSYATTYKMCGDVSSAESQRDGPIALCSPTRSLTTAISCMGRDPVLPQEAGVSSYRFEHSTEHSTLETVTGSAQNMSFIVSRDDNDWRFIISSTNLTTEREGRELRILVPKPGVNYDAKAGVWMLTGQCVMTINQGR
jgi:hypothetical protein